MKKVISALSYFWAGLIFGVGYVNYIKFQSFLLTREAGIDIGRISFGFSQYFQASLFIFIFLFLFFSRTLSIRYIAFFIVGLILIVQMFFLYPTLVRQGSMLFQGLDIHEKVHHSLFVVLEILKFFLILAFAIQINVSKKRM